MKIATIIPAYNEENTIADVVTQVKRVSIVDEVLVISDGSVDNTVLEARRAGAKVIELNKNVGKGGAMMTGVDSTNADIILFLDADLKGITPKHVENMLLPVVYGEAETTIGIFGNGRLATDLAQVIAPYLSGQRAIKREIIKRIPNLELTRFGIEIALTKYLKDKGISIKEVELKEMTHIMKEEKLGLVRGLKARMRMYWEIAKLVKRG